MPPAWTPLANPRKLEADRGNYFRDPNAARSPGHPLEPAVRALQHERPNFDTQKIDLFACLNTVRFLLEFLLGRGKPFRFLVEVIGKTVFFTRYLNDPTELIPDIKGYGHTFPEFYTTWDSEVKGSDMHLNILKYNLAGLNCIIRCKCDGYREKTAGATKPSTFITTKRQSISEDDFDSIFKNTRITSCLNFTRKKDEPVKVKPAGRKVSQQALFDLKTRSDYKKEDVLEEELHRYWLAQIPNMILAQHRYGIFKQIQVRNIENDVKRWQEEHHDDIRKLSWLLRKIIAVAKSRNDLKLEVCCQIPDQLELREQDSSEHDALPLQLKRRWLDAS